MDAIQFDILLSNFQKSHIFAHLVRTNEKLSRASEADLKEYELILVQSLAIIGKLTAIKDVLDEKMSLNIVKLASRNIVAVLKVLSTKTFDVANGMLNQLTAVNDENLAFGQKIAVVLLIDLFDQFHQSLSSVNNYSITLIYKILKKNPAIDHNLVYLLSLILKSSSKGDVDEKMQLKLTKIINKALLTVNSPANTAITTLARRNYVYVLKNLLILSINLNYEGLLTTTNANGKLNPESVLSQQHHYQTSLLQNNRTLINLALCSNEKELRMAMVDLMANLLINFIPTGKFSPIEYLVESYPLPWFDPPASNEKEQLVHDSGSIINRTLNDAKLRAGLTESIVYYLQLEQFQNVDFLTSNINTILDLMLVKFNEYGNVKLYHTNSIQWNKILDHWKFILDFVIDEAGSTLHEILLNYVYGKFNIDHISIHESIEYVDSKKKKDRTSGFFKKSATGSKSSSIESEAKGINPYVNQFQTMLLMTVLENLFESTVNVSSFDDNDASKSSNTIRLLLKLLVNNNSIIRNRAIQSLLKYCQFHQNEINILIDRLFQLLNTELSNLENSVHGETTNIHENVSNQSYLRMTSYSLALSSLIKTTNPTVLQNSAMVKILSFCTQTLKTKPTNKLNYYKILNCWIILTALVTLHNDSDFIKLNSSQFLIFWKNLLTSQYISVNNGEGVEFQTELANNLKLRNLSLTCLLNFINTAEMTPEFLKQAQFLLNKSLNYVNHLENTYNETVGNVTNFNHSYFNDLNWNINDYGDLIFSNEAVEGVKTLGFDTMMIGLILSSKKILLENYIKLTSYVKNDLNSTLILYIIKVFSDSRVFSRDLSVNLLVSQNSSSSKKNQMILKNEGSNEMGLVLYDETKWCFGVTSLLNAKTASQDQYSWFDKIESTISQSVIDNDMNYDPIKLLTSNGKNTNLTTSIVDLSIELFQLIFPYLSLKIQLSLLEQLRSSMLTTNIDLFRKRAISINISIALHGLLQNYIKNKIIPDKEISKLIVDTVEKIELHSDLVQELNCESMGMLVEVAKDKDFVNMTMNKIINGIINDETASNRGKLIFTLAKIYQFTEINFIQVYGVTKQLIKDPNPIVHYWSLRALNLILEKSHLDNNLQLVPELLELLESFYLNDQYGYDLNNKILVNLKTDHGSIGHTIELMNIVVSSMGPNVRDLSETHKTLLRNIIVCSSSGIGCYGLDDYNHVHYNVLRLLRELIIFDPIEGEKEFFVDLLDFIISKNIKIGISTLMPTSVNNDAIFPFNTSNKLYTVAIHCYLELIKLYGVEVLTKSRVKMFWIAMNLRPCDELQQLVQLWLELSADITWFSTLSTLYRYSSKKLMGGFIETNYSNKLVPLQQQKNKKNGKSSKDVFKDEEIENIVEKGDNEAEGATSPDKNEPINWRFKLFIIELTIDLLEISKKDAGLFDQLKSKIQDLVRMSFLGSTSSIVSIRLAGVELLDKVLSLFGDIVDPLYPTISLLEQQQAQIISSLVPLFNEDNDPKVMIKTIKVCSKFINLPRIKFYSKQRILRILIGLLEELSSNTFVKFGYIQSLSEFNKKSIQLSILNCWSLLRINLDEQNGEEPELHEILEKYQELLISMWILSLREFAMMKYNDFESKELGIYDDYWINFINVLSLELDTNGKMIHSVLAEDSSNFFFVLFSQCVESLIKNTNTPTNETLGSLNRLIKHQHSLEFIFNEDIFSEVIDLFDRLIIINSNEDKLVIVEIITGIFNNYIDNRTLQLNEDFDKLFELIRVGMLPIFGILPFLKDDHDETNGIVVKKQPSNMVVLEKCFESVVMMMSKFPDMVKIDLYSCLLHIYGLIYKSGDDELVTLVLPYLKRVILESKGFSEDILTPFYRILSNKDVMTKNDTLTYMLLITNGNVILNRTDIESLVTTLMSMLLKPESIQMSLQCIKSLMQYSAKKIASGATIMNILVPELIDVLLNNTEIKPRVVIDLLLVFNGNLGEEKDLVAFSSILIPILAHLDGIEEKGYLHGKLMMLVQLHPEVFKKVVVEMLNTEQKVIIEQLVKYSGDGEEEEISVVMEKVEHIQLKSFN